MSDDGHVYTGVKLTPKEAGYLMSLLRGEIAAMMDAGQEDEFRRDGWLPLAEGLFKRFLDASMRKP